MAERPKLLSGGEIKRIQRVVERDEARSKNTVPQPARPHRPISGREGTLVAWIGVSPIPAATEAGDVRTAGSLECALYRLHEDDELVDHGETATVLNITLADSPTNDFVLVHREELTGRVIFSGAGSGSGGGSESGNPCGDCTQLAVGSQDCLGTNDAASEYEVYGLEAIFGGVIVLTATETPCEFVSDDLNYVCEEES